MLLSHREPIWAACAYLPRSGFTCGLGHGDPCLGKLGNWYNYRSSKIYGIFSTSTRVGGRGVGGAKGGWLLVPHAPQTGFCTARTTKRGL